MLTGQADALAMADASDPGPTKLRAFHRKRKQDSRDRLLAAALAQFGARGYLAVSVEDIAIAAGVSRVTFYRHFSGKDTLAVQLFLDVAKSAMPRFLRIGLLDFHDRPTVRAWINGMFAVDRENRAILTVFTQATVEGGEFLKHGHQYLADNIKALGEFIPAFALDADSPTDRRRWIEAWLLIYEIKDQSNHAALESGVATDPLVIDILADRFLAFVNG
jgi:AcrR family transcriptional regulator